MSGFKLLAIRPLEDCDSDFFLKNLEEGEIYKFHQEFEFYVDYNSELRICSELRIQDYKDSDIAIIKSPRSSNDLYSDGNLKINITAIVGKNGSGKSALLELLNAAIYNISIKSRILKDPENDKLFSTAKMHKKLKVELFYLIEDVTYLIRINGSKIVVYTQTSSGFHYEEEKTWKKEDLLNFFYTISINYSVYGLNSKEIGYWINSLFHKNDGYQTPMVINPMRSEGNYNINDEAHLMNTRLLANIASDPSIKISEKQNISKIQFKLIKIKKSGILYEEGFKIQIDKTTFFKNYNPNENYNSNKDFIFRTIRNIFQIKNKPSTIQTEIEDYILKKLFKIAYKYPQYDKFLNRNTGTAPSFFHDGKDSFSEYLRSINEDFSHITFKLRQAINFLKFDWKTIWFNNLYSKSNHQFIVSFNEFSEKVKELSNGVGEDIVNVIPPPIFSLEFVLTSLEGKDSQINKMSSGELQKIASVQSILYHLRNLDSIFSENDNLSKNRIKYSNINILLDEVELYFHPEYQRSFISELLFGIKKMNLGICKFTPENTRSDVGFGVKSINIIFSTHSPFILSDIPSSNILRLENGEVSTNDFDQTFGANIHDLLANDFFLENGFMGEFAKHYILDLMKELQDLSHDLLDLDLYKAYLNRIEIIGEPVLANSLKSLLNTKFDKAIVLDRREKELMKELEKIKEQKSK